ncbi:hypothetical protein D3273_09850 [Lichenibacterium minor]|jgi:hypothetical protein|uniref:Uncharacterized protein n=1 Tax=Lichenibacterium minor TaxID=2316528 RepID=A0A4Q2U7C3_9HYPH|nr:hypothetical protein [Lichenibacterium minor]RYC32320.1 hypothetical protein D3273_09850 [Lichenibacterium minor]
MAADPRRTSRRAFKDARSRTEQAIARAVRAERVIDVTDKMAAQAFVDLGASRTLLGRPIFSM